MIKTTLGAPLGGTICGGQDGFESLALRLMTPPNFAAGFGRYFPSMVVVPLGDPGAGVVPGWSPGAESLALGSCIATNWTLDRLSALQEAVTDFVAVVALVTAESSGERAFALGESSRLPVAAA